MRNCAVQLRHELPRNLQVQQLLARIVPRAGISLLIACSEHSKRRDEVRILEVLASCVVRLVERLKSHLLLRRLGHTKDVCVDDQKQHHHDDNLAREQLEKHSTDLRRRNHLLARTFSIKRLVLQCIVARRVERTLEALHLLREGDGFARIVVCAVSAILRLVFIIFLFLLGKERGNCLADYDCLLHHPADELGQLHGTSRTRSGTCRASCTRDRSRPTGISEPGCHRFGDECHAGQKRDACNDVHVEHDTPDVAKSLRDGREQNFEEQNDDADERRYVHRVVVALLGVDDGEVRSKERVKRRNTGQYLEWLAVQDKRRDGVVIVENDDRMLDAILRLDFVRHVFPVKVLHHSTVDAHHLDVELLCPLHGIVVDDEYLERLFHLLLLEYDASGARFVVARVSCSAVSGSPVNDGTSRACGSPDGDHGRSAVFAHLLLLRRERKPILDAGGTCYGTVRRVRLVLPERHEIVGAVG